jgi:hypothetical protein
LLNQGIQQQQQQRIHEAERIIFDADKLVPECKKASIAFVLRRKYIKLFNTILNL